MSTDTETYLSISNTSDVIHNLHSIPIRYHLIQDDHQDEPLSIGEHCYIVFNDRLHPTYLVSAVIISVDCTNYEYKVRRINDNDEETYPWTQIVVEYNKQIHSVNIEQHKQKIAYLRNNPQSNTQLSPSPSPMTQQHNARKRKREENENDHNNELQPNKKRKLNNFDTHNLCTVAQPYFPIPHPYFRQNALIKWKPNTNDNGEWDVGRIVDFDLDSSKIYVQNTYRCGTKDDELQDIFCVDEWDKFVDETEAQLIDDIYLYRLHSPILYWWDRAGCGSICEDSVEGLDYGADNELIYGITGGKNMKQKKKKKVWNPESLKWCHKDGIFGAHFSNKVTMSKYICKNYKELKSPRDMKSISALESSNKLLDVIVIGAGIAGLTARWALNKSGYSCKILEAQDYVGGRLKQHHFASKLVCDPMTGERYFMPRVSVELGAAFLSGSGRDNRFWSWFHRQNEKVCADWGGYNNGWWNGDSFIDSKKGSFVNKNVIERIKTICDDIQTLACKLLMPLDDLSVIDALQHMKHRIPRDQLFVDRDDDGEEIERYFYLIYDKYAILSANWVGPQGLWQQQQTQELQNLDFEALYRFLHKIGAAKKYLKATERIIIDYYGDKTNIKTENFDAHHVYHIDNDSEATESEADDDDHDEFRLSEDDIVRYDVSDYGDFVPFQYKFGYRDILVRDLINPQLREEEAHELQKTSGLSAIDYQRFQDALQYLADCNLFSFHLYFLRERKNLNNEKVTKLLRRFARDLDLFDEIVIDFKKILMGKELKLKEEEIEKYHNRKTMMEKKEKSCSPLRQKKIIEKEDEFAQNVFDDALSLNPDAQIAGDGFVVNGYSQCVGAFRVNESNSLHLNHRVCSVERIGKKEEEICQVRGIDLASGKPFCFWSRFVVCSVPLGVLKLSLHKERKEGEYNGGIVFKPQLSSEKQEAITAMGMGVENKVYLRFTACFWPRDKPYFQSIQHPEYRFINLSYNGFKLPPNTNVLCSMIPPNVARKWRMKNPAQQLRIIWDVLRVLNEMFGKRKNCDETNNCDDPQRICKLGGNDDGIAALLRLLVDYKVTDWEHNLFTRGSYSFLPKGAIYTHCKSLLKYDGNGLYFCGEATSVEGFECVDGAHETGFAQAKQIHKEMVRIKEKKKKEKEKKEKKKKQLHKTNNK